MSEEFKKENRYIVIKREDANRYLSDKEKDSLAAICESIKDGRAIDNKPSRHYVCIPDHYPMYNKVWKWLENWVLTQKKGRYVLPHRSGGGIPSNPECSICHGWCGGGYEGKPCEFKG